MVGIRPQRLVLGPPDPQEGLGTIPGELLVHEFLGKEGIAQVAVNDVTMECVTEPDIPFNEGDAVSLKFSMEDMHFFDPETTMRVVD